jgi:hypothetical protein
MHSIEEFHIGEEVYHLTNKASRFIVVEIMKEENYLICSYWIENTKKTVQFFPYELGKVKELDFFYVPTILE